MRLAGHVALMEIIGMLVGFWWESRMVTTMTTKTKWLDNFRMYLRETGRGGVDWIDLAQDKAQWRAFVNTVMIPQNVGKLLSSCTIGYFSRRADLRGVSPLYYS
jgi:hypothetical protein